MVRLHMYWPRLLQDQTGCCRQGEGLLVLSPLHTALTSPSLVPTRPGYLGTAAAGPTSPHEHPPGWPVITVLLDEPHRWWAEH